MAKSLLFCMYGCKQEQTAKIGKMHAEIRLQNRKPKRAMPQNVDQLAMDFAKLTIALDVSFSCHFDCDNQALVLHDPIAFLLCPSDCDRHEYLTYSYKHARLTLRSLRLA